MTDHSSVNSVARWAYSNAASAGAHGWIKSSQYEQIDTDYLNVWPTSTAQKFERMHHENNSRNQ